MIPKFEIFSISEQVSTLESRLAALKETQPKEEVQKEAVRALGSAAAPETAPEKHADSKEVESALREEIEKLQGESHSIFLVIMQKLQLTIILIYN